MVRNIKQTLRIFAFSVFSFFLFASAGRAQNVEEAKTQGQVSELTADSFKARVMDYEKHPKEWVFAGEKPAVVDFYATWCGPCKQVAPVLARLSEEFSDSIDFYKVDIDKSPELAALFGIRSIPTVLFVPMKGLPQKAVGAMPKSSYEEIIRKLLLVP